METWENYLSDEEKQKLKQFLPNQDEKVLNSLFDTTSNFHFGMKKQKKHKMSFFSFTCNFFSQFTISLFL